MSFKAPHLAYSTLLLGAVISSTAAPAHALEPSASSLVIAPDVDHQSFEADFFDQYTPQTALDMIKRLPGFVYDGGSSARGFGGTAGNVLIDGARPTSKSGGLSEALSRIPATQVARIDVRRGAIGAGEAAGQTMVANVVRLKNVSTGTWTVGIRKFDKSRVLPSLSGTFSTQILGWDTSLKLVTFFKDESRQAVIDRHDANGTLTSRKTEDRLERNRDGNLSFDAGHDAFGGRLQINGRIGFDSWYGDTERLGRGTGAATGPITDRFFDDHNFENYEAELGVDWSRTFDSGWKWRLIALATLDDWAAIDDITFEKPTGSLLNSGRFRADEKSTETIVRTTLGRNGNRSLMPEFGIEGAFNTLNSSLEIAQYDGTGAEIYYRPSRPVRVEEARAEAFGNLVWQVNQKLSFDGGIRAELSRISTSGQASQSRTFRFVKPSLGMSYTASDELQFDVKLERTMGQLNFGDFAASADATDDRLIAGNPDLRPDRTDRLEGTANYQYSDRGALSVTLYHEWKDDVLERTVLPSGAQARANVGSARRWGIDATATIPTDRILKGGLLGVQLYAKGSSFLDPLTGETRRLHDFVPFDYYIDFRHDIPGANWAWGVEYDSNYNWHGYYVDEFEDFKASDRWDLFVETTRFFGVKMKLTSFYTFSVQRDRIRNLYAPTRGDAFVGTEISRRERDTGFLFEVSSQF